MNQEQLLESKWRAFIEDVHDRRQEQNCPTSEELAAYFKGLADSRLQKSIHQHLSGCNFCSLELKAVYKRVKGHLLTSNPDKYKGFIRKTKQIFTPKETPFVGRNKEIIYLKLLWSQVQNGKGQVVEITGNPGIGKTRLIQEFRREVTNDSASYLCGHCHILGREIPYLPLNGIVSDHCNITSRDNPRVFQWKIYNFLGKLGIDTDTIAFLLSNVFGILSHDEIKHDHLLSNQMKVFEILNSLFISICRISPLIIEIEDLQWIDSTSENYFLQFLQDIADLPIFVIMTYRQEYNPPWGNKFKKSRLVLGTLSAISSHRVMQEALQFQSCMVSLSAPAVGRNWGNPFFLEELAYSAMKQDGWFPRKEIPNTIPEVLITRIEQLSPKAKQLLQAAAVIGTEIQAELLKSISPIKETEFAENLIQLQENKFIVRHQSMLGLTYKFRHTLTLNAVYQSMNPVIRQEYHRKIADILINTSPDIKESNPELLAYHYTGGKLYKEAIIYWNRASTRALLRSAYNDAIRHLQNGLALCKKSSRSTDLLKEELGLLEKLINALRTTKSYAAPELDDLCQRALILCNIEADKGPRQLAILRSIWACHLNRGCIAYAFKIAEKLLQVSSTSPQTSPSLIAESFYTVGNTLYHRGEFAQAKNYLHQSIDLWKVQSHPLLADTLFSGQDVYVASLSIMASTLWLLGYPDQARKKLSEAYARAAELNHHFSKAYALYHGAMFYHFCGEEQEAKKQAEELLVLSDQLGFKQRSLHASLFCGWAAFIEGREDDGLYQMQKALKLLQMDKIELGRSYGLSLLAQVYERKGRIDDGLRTLTEAMESIKNTEENRWKAEIHRLKGELLLKGSTENQKEAEESFQAALGTARRQEARSLELRAAMSLAQFLQRRGQHPRTCQPLVKAYSRFTEGFKTADLKKAKALLSL